MIELIWKTMIGSLERKILLPTLFFVQLLPVTVNNFLKKLTMYSTNLSAINSITVSQVNWFLMIGSHE